MITRTISAETVQLRPERLRRTAADDARVERGAFERVEGERLELGRLDDGDVRAGIYTSTTTGKTNGRRRVCS